MNFFNFGKKKKPSQSHTTQIEENKSIVVKEVSLEEQILKQLTIINNYSSDNVKRVHTDAVLSLTEKEAECAKKLKYLEKFLDIIVTKEFLFLALDKIKSIMSEILINCQLNNQILGILYKILKLRTDPIAKSLLIEEIIVYLNTISKTNNDYTLLIAFLLKAEKHLVYSLESKSIIEAVDSSITELTKDANKSNIILIKELCSKYEMYEMFDDERVFNFFISVAKQTNNCTYLIQQYYKSDEVLDIIIDIAQKNQDCTCVIQYFYFKQSIFKQSAYSSISIENRTKAANYLLSNGKVDEVVKFIEKTSSNHLFKFLPIISSFLEYCISNNDKENLKSAIEISKKFPECQTIYNMIKKIDKDKLIDILVKQNSLENDIRNFVLVLFLEAEAVLKDHENVIFSQNPEVEQSLKVLNTNNGKNYQKFHSSIRKIIKSGKPTLALYILNNYGGYSSLSDAKLWIDSYVDSFVILERVDILAKYYNDFVISAQNIELLQSISDYYIKEKEPQKASIIIENISKLEPTYPYIQTARLEIDRLTMMQELSQNDLDIDSINTLKGEEFENLLIQKFEELGFKVTETPKTRDFGADIIVDTENETRFVIQCKRFKSKVNLKAVQEVVGALPHYGGDIGIVITNSGFLSSAIKLAESNDIELWDNLRLMKFLTGDISFSQLSEL